MKLEHRFHINETAALIQYIIKQVRQHDLQLTKLNHSVNETAAKLNEMHYNIEQVPRRGLSLAEIKRSVNKAVISVKQRILRHLANQLLNSYKYILIHS